MQQAPDIAAKNMERGRQRSWITFDHLLPCAATALIVIGARLWLVSLYGTSLPINDQWGDEGFYLLKPWYEGRLTLGDLLAPHNEHRLFFSRLLTLTLTAWNGQWDSMLQMAFDAVFCGAIAALLLGTWFRIAGGRFRLAGFVALTLCFALPYAHENTLWGFQSSFYFLLFFSLLGLWGLVHHRPYSAGWRVGASAVIGACLSMASGILCAIAVGAILGLQVIVRQRSLRDAIPTTLFLVIIVSVGLAFQVTIPEHTVLHAHNVFTWVTFFARCLAWPFSDQPAVAIVAYAPFVLFAASELSPRLLKTKESPRSIAPLLLVIGIWVILQAAAVAYSRGGDGTGRIASRYLDILGVGVVGNVLCLCFLLVGEPKRRFHRVAVSLGGIWLFAFLGMGLLASYREIRGQYGRQAYLLSAEKAVRGYLATNDRHYLDGEPHPVPYPDLEALATFLNDKSIQAILPASARLPLTLQKTSISDDVFTRPGISPPTEESLFEKAWGSYSALGASARGSMFTELFRPRLPYLELEIAGGLDENSTLALEGDHQVSRVDWMEHFPRGATHPDWRLAYARVPAPLVQIHAVDNSTTGWFAFREPREMGMLSYYAQRVTHSGKSICLIGIAAGMLWLGTLAWPVIARSRLRGNGAPLE